ICPTIYAPVCAVTPKGGRETFANSCLAKNAHARVLHNGRCIGAICVSFKQVCARVPGHKAQTFASECTAEQANATVLYDAPCKKSACSRRRAATRSAHERAGASVGTRGRSGRDLAGAQQRAPLRGERDPRRIAGRAARERDQAVEDRVLPDRKPRA